MFSYSDLWQYSVKEELFFAVFCHFFFLQFAKQPRPGIVNNWWKMTYLGWKYTVYAVVLQKVALSTKHHVSWSWLCWLFQAMHCLFLRSSVTHLALLFWPNSHLQERYLMSGTQRNSSGFFGLLMNEFFKISALIGGKLHRANWNYFSLFFLDFFSEEFSTLR